MHMPKGLSFNIVFVFLLTWLTISVQGTAYCSTLVVNSQIREVTIAAIFDREEGGGGAGRITQTELLAEVMRFADRAIMKISEAVENIRRRSGSPQVRARAFRQAVLFGSAVMTIAAGPSPEVNLLDMVVLVTLGHIKVQEYWIPLVLGGQGDLLLKAYQGLEKDIWSIVAMVLTTQQQRELRGLIREWIKTHPDQHNIVYVRFSEFAKAHGEAILSDPDKARGLFSSVKRATVAVDEIRLAAERASFYLQRVHIIAGLQAELVFYEYLAAPEVEQLRSDTRRFIELLEQFSATTEKLSEQFSETRLKSLLTDTNQTVTSGNELVSSINETTRSLDALLGRLETAPSLNEIREVLEETSEAVKQVESLTSEVGELLRSQDLEKTVSELEGVLTRIEETKEIKSLLTDTNETITSGNELVSSINTTTRSLDALIERLETAPSLNEIREVVEETSEAVKQIETLTSGVGELLGSQDLEKTASGLDRVLTRIEATTEKEMNRAFKLAVALILIFLAGSVLAMLSYKYASARIGKN
jgi:hypothetical protein